MDQIRMVIVSSLCILAVSTFCRFTLHLCGKSESDDLKISSPLPLNQNFVQLFAKFLRYLFHCAAHRIKKAYAIEPTLWESIKNDMELVISYPSGCGRMQQNEMRRAIVISKLIPDTTAGHARLSFVAEGEASLYFSIQNGLPVDATRVRLPSLISENDLKLFRMVMASAL